MVATRSTRRPSSDDSEELGLEGAKTAPSSPEDEGSEAEEGRDTEAAEEEESDKAGDARPVKHAPAAAAPKPNETPKQAKKPSPPPPEDAGAQGSGGASPVRDAPLVELEADAAHPPRKKSKAKKTTKRVKRPPPPSHEERAQDQVEESGDPSLVSKAPAGETAAVSPRRAIVVSADHNKRGASPPSPKRAKRGAAPTQEDEEQAEKRAAGADDNGTSKAAAESGAPADKVNRKRMLRKVLAKPPSALEEEQQGEEDAEQEHAGNILLPQQKDGAHAALEDEERAQVGVEFGDPSLVTKAPADKTAAMSPWREIVVPPYHNRSGTTSPAPKRAKRGATLSQEEEEQAKKHTAGADDDGISKAAAGTGALADKVNRKKKGKKKKVRKVLVNPPQPDCTELGLTGNREGVPDIGNTSSPLEKDIAQEKEQQGETVEHGHAGSTSLPQVNHGAHEEEHQGNEDAEQEHVDNTSLSQQKDGAQEDEDTGVVVSGEALPGRNALSRKLRTSKGEKKPAVERSWSQDDTLKILNALVDHAQSHGGALLDSSDLLANLTFDKTDANEDKLNDKIRKLKARYRRWCSQGRPTDDLGRRLFELSAVLWSQVDDGVRVEVDFSQRSSLYPYLAEEVKVYAETHSSGSLVMAAFTTIGDDKARRLDAMCKKQRVDAYNLELSQANLTKAMLSAFSSEIN
ncbi:hypothetical protein BAE44_0007912 [Dichanthelium oligosanthes]|uniref:Glabrous enhancer-binding protein-like DBD domain-containing protein n=1 Tax=Dichanthelium oligosanthes TaxID=888268 RepID=A0A1E5W107_9POAL|nr:hypothetical protein BAE44_0007912 [Dichanthelium oligosanthes]